MNSNGIPYEHLVAIGASAGGMTALGRVLPMLHPKTSFPLVVVQHLHPRQGDYHLHFFGQQCPLRVKEAEDKEVPRPGVVYFAPPNYHLLLESDGSFALSVEEKVNYSRPSIDVFFETAARVFGSRALGIILTGANHDGAAGLRRIVEAGGIGIAQSPEEAELNVMPRAAIELALPQHVLTLERIGEFLRKLGQPKALPPQQG